MWLILALVQWLFGRGYATTARLGLKGFCGKWGLTFALAVYAQLLRLLVCPHCNG